MAAARILARAYAHHRFTLLFAVLLLTIGAQSIVGRLLPIANPLDWLLGLSLLAVVLSVRGGRFRWVLYALAVAFVAARLARTVLDHPAPLLASQSAMAMACLLAAAVAVRRALAAGPVDAEHVSAALDAYVLVGLAFGVGYWVLEAVLPGSFTSGPAGTFTPRAPSTSAS